METGNEAAMRSLWSPFTRRLTSFLKNAFSFAVDPEAAAVDALYAKIADWDSMLLAFSFASAVQIATASSQIQSKLPPSFHLLSLSILLGFSSLLVAKLAEFKTVKPSKLLHCLGFLSLVIAFFLAISTPFPLNFQIISFALFLVTLALVLYFTIIHKT